MARSAVILDIDGTLLDSNDAHARAWVDAFGEAGIEVDYERVRRSIGMGGDKLMPHVAGLTEDSPEGHRIAQRRGEIFKSRYLPHVAPFPRVRELVERFAQGGFTIVVASSAQEDELGPLLERAGVADLIESKTSSDDAENSKPDPDIVKAALRRSGAPRHAAVMLGDTPYDVAAARRTGIAVVGVECGGWSRNDLHDASAIYASPADLLERYEESIFARFEAGGTRSNEADEVRRLDMNRVMLVAAGIAGLALIAIVLRAMVRRARRDAEDEPADARRPGLGPRERAQLRQLIERTS